LDLISDRAVDEPEFYIMHPWSMNFRVMVETLNTYFSSCKIRPEEAYIWMDIFCINHHKTPLLSVDFSTVGEVIGKVPKVMMP
jgi:hypothetical protein